MKRSSRVFGTPVYLNGTPSMSLNGSNTIEVVDGNGASVECCAFNVENSAVNVIEFNATSTGNKPSIEVTGDDADIDLNLIVKGTGLIEAGGDIQPDTGNLKDSNGNVVLNLPATGSAVNYLAINNSATGNSPTINAVGTDSDVDVTITPKGTGGVVANAELFAASNLVFQTAGSEIWVESPTTGGKAAVKLNAADNAVNYLEVSGSATGNSVMMAAGGTDTDIEIEIAPKGTGVALVSTSLDVVGSVNTGVNESYGGGTTTLVAARQTTDDTPTPITSTDTIPEGVVLSITADVVGVETDQTNRAVYRIHGLFYRNNAGNVTQQGATVSLNTIETDANWDVDFALDVGNQEIDVQATGAAATTINWKAHVVTNVVAVA